jgi:DNA-binding transcriptional ArsR family regulator
MDEQVDMRRLTGNELVRVLSALSSPHRLRILATLAGGSVHVSQLAREVGLSRPLVHMHLRRLETAGLVKGRLELSDDGKALRFFEVTPFAIHLTPDLVVEAARTLEEESELETNSEKEEKR